METVFFCFFFLREKFEAESRPVTAKKTPAPIYGCTPTLPRLAPGFNIATPWSALEAAKKTPVFAQPDLSISACSMLKMGVYEGGICACIAGGRFFRSPR